MSFTLTSSAVKNGILADKYGDRCDPQYIVQGIPQISFPLEWNDVPEGTESFAIIFMDYDNTESEGFPFVHWTCANIPADFNHLDEDSSRKDPEYLQGANSWSTVFGPYESITGDVTRKFGGPAPGDVQHEYELVLYALDKKLDLEEGFSMSRLRKEMRGHILGEAILYSLY